MSPRVELMLSGSELGVIIERSSGVIYENQTMGYACAQSELEGVYVSLLNDDIAAMRFWKPLNEHFAGPTSKHMGGGAVNGIDDEDADVIDAIFAGCYAFAVDRARLKESHEAWVFVTIQGDSYWRGFGPYPIRGVLTWENSD